MHLILFYEVVDDFVAKRQPFRADHLKKAREAYDRGDLVLAGGLLDPVDSAGLLLNGSNPEVAHGFAPSDPYVAIAEVKNCYVRSWMTDLRDGASIRAMPAAAMKAGSR